MFGQRNIGGLPQQLAHRIGGHLDMCCRRWCTCAHVHITLFFPTLSSYCTVLYRVHKNCVPGYLCTGYTFVYSNVTTKNHPYTLAFLYGPPYKSPFLYGETAPMDPETNQNLIRLAGGAAGDRPGRGAPPKSLRTRLTHPTGP